MFRKIMILAVMMTLFIGFTRAADKETKEEIVKIEMKTNFGTIELELWPKKSPITVNNFVKYVKDGFYDGTIFHRVIDNFMIQAGGFTKEGTRKPTTYDPIKNEADNMLSNETGTIAMARTPDPHSATSQFFINVKDNINLDHRNKSNGWGYCVFGKVTKGMDVVNHIKVVETHLNPQTRARNWPVEVVLIEKVSVID